MIQVYVALGANLSQPIEQLNNACQALLSIAEEASFSVSPYYRSVPMGEVEQPDYVNAVATFKTDLAPLALLDALQKIENEQGRLRTLRWGPRTLDLDLLLYGNEQINLPRLTVPHYGMKQRSFVLVPLFDLSPTLVLPDEVPLSSLITDALVAELQLAQQSEP
ncbi:2-amino-4-hydroxy-6-hydroxymethyldihydropteridine pyrophosphokinase [Shewanella piezotolerans WP3]|uniref:2-amino-4-hydroxy-6-hydroxymethyldihydropteridine pyrophosphokinase n=1 Tax=Shewanella piezotolerans (strain WP3 / JCM 13877) TaxID=225849 RepID=B8CTC5_SHEPW|nr:2-amino-4-hydroxy-6-hydroxymethyldihydropteridine diphosphokinase [Shewanella piezotolerans]ACJ31034.1 2-amino-4-hydroxy-6-hydroxymethyldihydropteridine pyrophosphokinase [Shewanella piezotolerans WP3]